MTERVKGFVVALENDWRDDDAEVIRAAIMLIRGVAGVEPLGLDPNDHANRLRIRSEIEHRLFELIRAA